MSWLEIAGGLITVGGAAAGVAIFVTRSLYEAQQERLKTDLAEKEKEKVAVEKEKTALEARYRQLLEAGNLASTMMQGIEDEFALMADRVKATAGSIFVPAPSYISDENPSDLVFFSCFGGADLKRERVPISETEAGRAFATEQPIVSGAAAAQASFSAKTDRAVNFHTQAKVSVPLFHRHKCVGVAQFLNKKDQSGAFSDADVAALLEFRSALGSRVGEFIKDPENLKKIGITPRENAAQATILFADISNSSRLMRSLDTAQVIDMYNQYFEDLCEVALRHGGTVDQFQGDGVMISFNAKRPVPNHELRALEAAVEMQRKFSALKKRWTDLGYRATPQIYNRIGINAGPVKKAELGHSQFRSITVMGDAVNFAKHLCDLGDRGRNVIVLGAAIKSSIPEGWSAKPLPPNQMGEAYELTSSGL
mgnify:CR=1 FL=1